MTNGSLKLGVSLPLRTLYSHLFQEDSDSEEDLTKYIDTATYPKGKVNVDKTLDSELSFTLLVQKIRRKYMINAITSKDETKKVRGQRILKNVEKQLAIQKSNRANGFELDDDLIDEYKVDFGIQTA